MRKIVFSIYFILSNIMSFVFIIPLHSFGLKFSRIYYYDFSTRLWDKFSSPPLPATNQKQDGISTRHWLLYTSNNGWSIAGCRASLFCAATGATPCHIACGTAPQPPWHRIIVIFLPSIRVESVQEVFRCPFCESVRALCLLSIPVVSLLHRFNSCCLLLLLSFGDFLCCRVRIFAR